MRIVTPLTEKNGALRHDDAKQLALIQAAVSSILDERENKIAGRLEKVIERFENGMGRLMDTVEAFRRGDRDTSVVNLVDSLDDDLPSLSRVKTVAVDVYTLSTSDIAQTLGVPRGDVAFLLNSQGMDWVNQKPDLWDAGTYRRTKRRMWHSTATLLLAKVFSDPNHVERTEITKGAERVINRCAAAYSARLITN